VHDATFKRSNRIQRNSTAIKTNTP